MASEGLQASTGAARKRCQMLVDDLVSRALTEQPGIVRMFDYYESLSPSSITERRLFTEVCWICYSSGFRYSVVEKYWPRIRRALYGFDVHRAAADGLDVTEAAFRVCETSGFRNLSKASWCVENARRIPELEEDWRDIGGLRGFFEHLATEDPRELVRQVPAIVKQLGLKGIGKTTAFHLMKNVGIDIFKPDIHVRRLLTRMELISQEDASPEEVCEAMVFLSSASGYKVSQLDTFLFAYGITIGDYLQRPRS